MKLDYILFVSISYAVMKILIIDIGIEESNFEFPTLDTPDIDFVDLSGGCAGFVDCTEYLANAVINIGAGIIFVILFIINLLVFLFEFFALVFKHAFSGIDGAPWYVNLIISLPFIAAASMITYRLIRSGESES